MSARPAAYLVCGALLAFANSGCLAAAVGACAAGAGVTANAYAKGKICHLYVADLNDSVAATHAALNDLGLPLEKENVKPNSAVLRTRTGDGDRVRIILAREASRIPADGAMTRIAVRVGTFGDHPLSERILVQIGAHLVPQAGPPLPGPGPVTPVAAAGTAPLPQEPPLAK